jgi:hypothetical protein
MEKSVLILRMTQSRILHLARVAGIAFCLGLLAPAMLLAQGRIEGKVLNGTTGRPVANQKVLLLTPKQGEGMQLITDTTTDSSGKFTFTGNGVGPGGFFLLQANFDQIPYHAAVPPMKYDAQGVATMDITVYDSIHQSSALQVSLLRVLVGADGPRLRVQEEYQVENISKPARTYTNPEGTFIFHVSPQAGPPTVSVTGLANMSLPQTSAPGKTPGEFKIFYALKPGVTPVTVAYDVDYSGGQFALNDHSEMPVVHAEMLVLPASLKVDSTIFKPMGVDSANNIQRFEANAVPKGTALVASVSGEAAANPQAGAGAGAPEGEIKSVANNMTRLGIPFFICLLLVMLWALGVRASKEWSKWKERQATSPDRKQLEAKTDGLFNSLADLDELFESGKIEKKKYWKERLELKAKLVAILKKGPPVRNEPYATRRNPR